MKIRFNTLQYKFSHGEAPRGVGQWGFEFGDSDTTPAGMWFSSCMSYGDAKQAARTEAARREYTGGVLVLACVD